MSTTITLLKALHIYRPIQKAYYKRGLKQRIEFYSQFVKKDDLCFDVGANIGNRSEVFLKLGAKVVAVEPQAEPYRLLTERCGKNQNFTALNKGLDTKEGHVELHACNVDGASSMSKEWINNVTGSGRFPKDYNWTKTCIVPVTTLDNLVKQYGKPEFCKVDVEGYEDHVIEGLHTPLQAFSFEFTPEIIQPILNVINHLETLGKYEYNFALGENMSFGIAKWVDADSIKYVLTQFKEAGSKEFGDVYCRLK